MAGLFNITDIWKVFDNSNPVLFDTGAGPEPMPPLELKTEDGIYLVTEDGNYLGVPE